MHTWIEPTTNGGAIQIPEVIAVHLGSTVGAEVDLQIKAKKSVITRIEY
jgi:antitoxin component of MazEF toxin-antitoxin module